MRNIQFGIVTWSIWLAVHLHRWETSVAGLKIVHRSFAIIVPRLLCDFWDYAVVALKYSLIWIDFNNSRAPRIGPFRASFHVKRDTYMCWCERRRADDRVAIVFSLPALIIARRALRMMGSSENFSFNVWLMNKHFIRLHR